MSRDRYQSYHRIHRDTAPSDLERGKISRETSRSARRSRKAQVLGRQLTRAAGRGTTIEDFEDDLLAEYADHLSVAQRDSRNAKGHKTRLKALERDKDFV